MNLGGSVRIWGTKVNEFNVESWGFRRVENNIRKGRYEGDSDMWGLSRRWLSVVWVIAKVDSGIEAERVCELEKLCGLGRWR